MDAIVVGAGFAGAILARELAENGSRVLVLEKRPQIGGNMFDSPDENGVLVHWYGPHIFHTNNEEVFSYLQKFSSWHEYEHRVKGVIQGKLVPIPFNFTSIEALFSYEKAEALKKTLRETYEGKDRVSVRELKASGNPQVRGLGEFVFENVFVNYTSKQWGIPASQVDASVIDRVPVVIGYDDRYFKDNIQMMPDAGFAPIFENMLAHENITCMTNTRADGRVSVAEDSILLDGSRFGGPVVYTGPIDELFAYKFGKLPYRSLDLQFESLNQSEYQAAAVVNYPNEEAFTRITEFKKLTGQALEGHTAILREYPMAYDHLPHQEAYYPIENSDSRALYSRYFLEARKIPNLHLCGRLSEYKYYNMDAVVAQALSLKEKIIKGLEGAGDQTT